jgi:hypothetical protein
MTKIFRSTCMLLLIAAVFAVVSTCPSPASAEMSPGDLIWAKAAVGPSGDYPNSVAVLQDGSLLMMGRYQNTLTLGAGEVGETTLLPRGGKHPFLANYNADGSLLGAAPVAGRSVWSLGEAVALADGGFVVAGDFTVEATFGSLSLVSHSDRDIYIVRYDANQQPLWAKRAGRRSTTGGPYEKIQVEGLAAFPDGSCVVTGFFAFEATFGLGESGETTIYSANDLDGFVARYRPDGSLDWAKAVGGWFATGVAAMPDGGCVVTGWYGNWDRLFIARFGADGTQTWIRQPAVDTTGCHPSARGGPIAAFSDGSCVVTGAFVWNMTFGPGEANETRLDTPVGPYGTDHYTFVARYNADGTLAWAKRGIEGSHATAIVPRSDGVLAVSYGGVGNYSADGTLVWQKAPAAASDSLAFQGVAVLPGGGYALLGNFQGTLTFPQGPGVTLQSVEGDDIFLATFYDPSVMPAAPFGPAPPPVTPPASGPEFISEEFRVASDGWSGLYALNYATAENWWTGSVFGEYAFPTSLPLGEWIGLSIYDLESGTWEEGVYLYKEEW